jgi:hypothetical protein
MAPQRDESGGLLLPEDQGLLWPAVARLDERVRLEGRYTREALERLAAQVGAMGGQISAAITAHRESCRDDLEDRLDGHDGAIASLETRTALVPSVAPSPPAGDAPGRAIAVRAALVGVGLAAGAAVATLGPTAWPWVQAILRMVAGVGA